MIPKIVHYIWVGHTEKPDLVKKCIDSWRRFLPDYEIIEWNEDNYNVNKNNYLKKAYQEKKWAFVSDYMRFDILMNYGGIYVDTDVEFLKPLPDQFLSANCFTGMECGGRIAPGLIFAAEANNWLVKKLVETYDNCQLDIDFTETVNCRAMRILENYGYCKEDVFQNVNGVLIYPSSYFCGYDQDIREFDIRKNTISVHHYAGTWKKQKIKRLIQQMIKKVLGIEGYRRFLALKKSLK